MLFAFITFQRAKCSALWTSCICSPQPVLSSAQNILGGCSCRQDTGSVLWDLCWPSPECQEQSEIPTHSCQRFRHLVADSWRKHPLIKQHISSRAPNFSFLLAGKSAVCCVSLSIGLLTSLFNLQAGPTCEPSAGEVLTQLTGCHHAEPLG